MASLQKQNNIHIDESLISRQMEFCKMNAELLLQRFGTRPKALVKIYGCQQNISDGQRIEGLLEAMGFDFCDNTEDADLVLFDTCAVRGHAEDRIYGNVGALKAFKARRKNRIVAVCGCMVQQSFVAEKFKKSYPHVDLLFGTHVQHKFPELLYEVLSKGSRVFDISGQGTIAEHIPTRRTGVKGWLPVMYGCNNFCTYCIVPYVRGRERSRNPEDIIAEAKEMIKEGYREITLLGQNVNSYGKNFEKPYSFANLLRDINALSGDFIIRFMTSHPKDLTDELIDALADCEKVAHHLHLPVQSGSDRILKSMNRVYTREHYLDLVKKVRKRIPDISLTSDIIVGFPGESEQDFADTLSLIEEVGYSALFTFAYSPREGPPAAKMEDQIPAEEKSRRLTVLSSIQEKISEQQNKKYLGKTLRVLCEGPSKKEGYLNGRSGGNISVEFAGDATLVNKFVNVKITEPLSFVLKGEIAE